MRSVRTLLLVSLTTAAIACGPAAAHPDSGTPGTDGGTHDSAMPGTDGGGMHDTGGGNDVQVVMGHCTTGTSLTGTCAAAVNLTTMGMMTGTTTTISGNNCMATAAPGADVPQPSCASSGGMTGAGYVVAFDYTMHAAGDLVAETDMGGTDTNLDTIVWITDGCGASANELACNDDISMDAHQSLTAPTHSLAAGAHVKIFVAGFTPPFYDGSTNQSNFTLTVTEHATVPMGSACNLAASFCADGTTCVGATPDATTGTCNADGTEEAHCLTTGTACMGNSTMAGTYPLGCNNPTPTADDPGFCFGVVPAGMVCTETDPLCVTNYTCIQDGADGGVAATTGHCILDGTLGGACTAAGTCTMGTCDMTSGICM